MQIDRIRNSSIARTCYCLEDHVLERFVYIPVSGLQTLDAQRVDVDARRVQKPPRERIENRGTVLPGDLHRFQLADHVARKHHGVSAAWLVVHRLRTQRHPLRLLPVLPDRFHRERPNLAAVVHALVRLRDVDDNLVMTFWKFIQIISVRECVEASSTRKMNRKERIYTNCRMVWRIQLSGKRTRGSFLVERPVRTLDSIDSCSRSSHPRGTCPRKRREPSRTGSSC